MVFIKPDWPAPDCVKALSTCRLGGVSGGEYGTFNLGSHVGDDELLVSQNKSILIEKGGLPAQPVWLEQVHGTSIVDIDVLRDSTVPQADASISRNSNKVCAVMTADCLPILLCKKDGSAVAAIHAGWRGLLAGIVEKTVLRLAEPQNILAWLGPAIGPGKFEVGGEVKAAFAEKNPIMQQAFQQVDEAHFHADLYALARITLLQSGVKRMYGGEHCTYNQPDQFYSYRRDGVTGRMASLIWLEAER